MLVRVSQWNFCIIFQAVVTSNLRACNNMSFEVYYNTVKQSRYTGNDLTVIIVTRLLIESIQSSRKQSGHLAPSLRAHALITPAPSELTNQSQSRDPWLF